MLYRKRIVKLAVEDAAGTKVAGTAALITEDLQITPAAPFEQRPAGGLSLGNNVAGVLGERIGTCSFKCELRSTAAVTLTMPKAQYRELTPGDRDGLMIYEATAQLNNNSGSDWLSIAVAAGTLGSGLDEVLKACGFALTSTTYAPAATLAAQKTVSIDVWEDGVKKGLAGAMGTLTLEIETGKRVMLNVELSGIWQTPVDEELPAFAPNASAVLHARGGAFTVATGEKLISRASIECGQQVTPRYDINAASGVKHYSVTDFDPTIGFDPESELVAAYDINGIWLAGTESAIVLTAA